MDFIYPEPSYPQTGVMVEGERVEEADHEGFCRGTLQDFDTG